MGLWRGKVQSISTGFYILPKADDKEASTYQEKRYIQKKKEEKNGKVSIKKHSVPRLGLGGLCHKKKKRRIIKCKSYRQISQEIVYGTGMSIFLSLYPKKFGYSLRGYSHRERCHAPDRKKSTEERWEIEANDKEPAGRQVV
jgi:hypothetical protein